MTELKALKNIGNTIAKKLNTVGISSAEQLNETGAKEAFVRLKLQYPNTCLVTLYALEGAVVGAEYNQLPDEVKKELKSFYDNLRNDLTQTEGKNAQQ